MPRLGLGRSLAKTQTVSNVTAGALYFNGVSINLSMLNALSLQDFTVMCWVKSDFSAACRIIDFRDSSGDGFSISQNSTTSIRASYNTVTGSYTSFVNGAWMHVAVTANTTTDLLTFVINGVEQTGVSIAGTDIDTITEGKIGCKNFGTAAEFFKGNMAQVAIFNTALTGSQIYTIMGKRYSQLTAGEKTNLVSWWSLTNYVVVGSKSDLHGGDSISLNT